MYESIPRPSLAIISALPLEHAAVRAMIDQPCEIPIEDVTYTVGNIGKHTVVAALLLQMGNNHAATAATMVLARFKGIRDVLMIGIAAGLPSCTSLGDVVVSDKGGALQYDNIKQTNGEIEVRDSTQKPSARMIGAINLLRTDEMIDQHPWRAHFQRLTATRYGRPIPGESCVHYGKIGSANLLLKDAARRDQIAADHGLIAFEMEASGIADATWASGKGYIVIRGVSDYADDKKNDVWQPYAALAAAAYARALIERLPAANPTPRDDGKEGLSTATKLQSLLHRQVHITPVIPHSQESADDPAGY